MVEGRLPSSKFAASHPPQSQRTTFNPIFLLQWAVGYEEATWHTICKNKDSSRFLVPLLNVTYIIEEHIQNLVSLCGSYKDDQSLSNSTLQHLSSNYSSPKLYTSLNLLSHNLALQFFSYPTATNLHHTNYFNNLTFWIPSTWSYQSRNYVFFNSQHSIKGTKLIQQETTIHPTFKLCWRPRNLRDLRHCT